MTRMICGVFVGLIGFILTPNAVAQSAQSPEQLIDQLQQIDCEAPGLSASASYQTFLAEDEEPQFAAGRLNVENGRLLSPPVCSPTPMRDLVRLGAVALPSLINHLQDRRPTKLTVGSDLRDEPVIFGGQYFEDEYSPRNRKNLYPACRSEDCKVHDFLTPYRVRVGDICYALIGQIVGRYLDAVRYQPTAIVIVNSPIEATWLAQQVKDDWGNTDREGLKQSLLSDVRMLESVLRNQDNFEENWLRDEYAVPFKRLRYFYPEAYAALTGSDLEKRKIFEAREAELAASRKNRIH